ncbi:MAG: hypothetical protein H6739_31295 [Alphaproteobacteria bacterium]|nr:hypothetical protein [Alphaproteobacteria bacterium]
MSLRKILGAVLEPTTMIALSCGGVLAVVSFMVALSPPREVVQIMEIPDRFVEVLLEEPNGRDVARAKGEPVDTMMAFQGKAPRAPTDPAPPPPAANQRSWFPKTFLWAPRVKTDAEGRASVSALMPDTLTTWRVLGLSATADGSVSGDTLSLRTTRDVYAEPVLPGWLTEGDTAEVAVRLVNLTDAPVRAPYTIRTDGLSGSAEGVVTLAPGRVQVVPVRLQATTPGDARLSVQLGDFDATGHAVEVRPRGAPVVDVARGLTGGGAPALPPRPEATACETRRDTHDGVAALLWDEVKRKPEGPYAFALGARGVGVVPYPEELRETRIRGQQGLVARATNADVPTAGLLLRAMAGDTGAIAERLRPLLQARLEGAQGPDGTVSPGGAAPLQQVLALTAWTVAVSETPGAKVRAGGAFERHAAALLDPAQSDPYTLGLVLASGAAEGPLAEALRALLTEQVTRDEYGRARLPIPDGVLRPDGTPAREVDALALAARALDGALSRDLGASLMASWSPAAGFGDEHSGVLALEALDAMDGASTWVETRTCHVPWTPVSGGAALTVAPVQAQVGQPVEVTLTLSLPASMTGQVEHRLPAGVRALDAGAEGARVVSAEEGRVVLELAAPHPPKVTLRYRAVPLTAGALWSGPAQVRVDDAVVGLAPPQVWRISPAR